MIITILLRKNHDLFRGLAMQIVFLCTLEIIWYALSARADRRERTVSV